MVFPPWDGGTAYKQRRHHERPLSRYGPEYDEYSSEQSRMSMSARRLLRVARTFSPLLAFGQWR